jgi:hypothetical protein
MPCGRSPVLVNFPRPEDEPGLAVSVFDLISVFREILERAKKRPQLQIRREEVTVAQMIEHVKQVLGASPGPVRLEDLIGDFLWRQALIALFLAVLELVRLRAVLLRQKDTFTSITIARSKRFEEVLAATTAQELAAGLDEESVKDEVGACSKSKVQKGPETAGSFFTLYAFTALAFTLHIRTKLLC